MSKCTKKKYYAVHKSKPNEELTHWKYIKREWDFNNKRYKYYYNDYKDLSTIEPKQSPIDTGKYFVKQLLGYDKESAYNTMKNEAKLSKDTADYRKKTIKEIKTSDEWKDYPYKDGLVKKIQDDVDYYEKDYKVSYKLAKRIHEDYSKTPLYKIRKLKTKIDKGKKKIDKLLKRVF